MKTALLAQRDALLADSDLPPGQDEMVRTGQIGLLCALLQRFCEDNELPFTSADELATQLRHEAERAPPKVRAAKLGQAKWLETYGALWDQSDLTETD